MLETSSENLNGTMIDLLPKVLAACVANAKHKPCILAYSSGIDHFDLMI